LPLLTAFGCGRAAPEVAGPGPTTAPPVAVPAEAPAPAGAAQRAGAPAEPAALAPAPPPRRPGAYANLDPEDDFVVGPPDELPDCEAQLVAAGVTFRPATLPVRRPKGSKVVCGAPQVVTYLRGPGKIAYNAPPLLTCGMALALASFERIVQAEAQRAFGAPVARVEHLGTYACREIAAYPGWTSEHSYANAIDLARFVLKNGTAVDVLRDFDAGEGEPRRPAGALLRAASRRAFDEDVFSHVLTPFFDAGHRNHFHLDLARFRGDGTRPAAPGGEAP
jgi:hypothetical protein